MFLVWMTFGLACGVDAPDAVVAMHRGNAGRTGVFAGRAPVKPTEALWRIDASVGHHALVAAGGRVYFGSGDGVLTALDAPSAKTAWTYGTATKERQLLWPRSPAPAVSNGTVYWGNGKEFAALSAETGQVRWRMELPGILSPTIANGILYVVGGDTVFAADAETGRERWRLRVEEPSKAFVSAGPVVSSGRVYIGASTRTGTAVMALDAATGQEQWKIREGDSSKELEGFVATIMADQGIVYFGVSEPAGGASFRAVDAGTGRERWRRSGLHDNFFVCPEPVIASGMVYFVAMEAAGGDAGPASVYALDARTGEERWRRQLELTDDDRFRTEIIFIGGALYMGLARALVAIDAKTGDERWRFKTDEHVYPGPTVSNGVLYFGGKGTLRAVR
jgi:outer membrane protein assembly factor BamB